jgi:hypothetical protein
MPHLYAAKSVQELRRLIHGDLEQLRELRNRIAHHEPIFKRALNDDFIKMQELIAFRCPTTSLWMLNNQHATFLIAAKPEWFRWMREKTEFHNPNLSSPHRLQCQKQRAR